MWVFTYQYTLTSGWLSGFAILTKYDPTVWVIQGLDEQDHSVLIVCQACQTLTMHSHDIWNRWQHIHGLWFFTYIYTPTLEWLGASAVLTKSGPTA